MSMIVGDMKEVDHEKHLLTMDISLYLTWVDSRLRCKSQVINFFFRLKGAFQREPSSNNNNNNRDNNDNKDNKDQEDKDKEDKENTNEDNKDKNKSIGFKDFEYKILSFVVSLAHQMIFL